MECQTRTAEPKSFAVPDTLPQLQHAGLVQWPTWSRIWKCPRSAVKRRRDWNGRLEEVLEMNRDDARIGRMRHGADCD